MTKPIQLGKPALSLVCCQQPRLQALWDVYAISMPVAVWDNLPMQGKPVHRIHPSAGNRWGTRVSTLLSLDENSIAVADA
jgi:hypothetical protein